MGRKGEETRSGDDRLLERQPTQRNVQSNTGAGTCKQYSPREGEVNGVCNPGIEVLKQRADEGLFAAETRQQSEINVDRLAGFSPPLQCQSANDAEPPILGFAKSLKLRSGTNDLIHGRQLS